MILLEGPFAGLPEVSFEHGWSPPPATDPLDYRSPSLWWPQDRAWRVATDVDLMSTYIGAARVCIEAPIADEHLEVLEVTADPGVTADSDTLNPEPAGSYYDQ
jgi:hypothetical protein